jgi:hypothetical protein
MVDLSDPTFWIPTAISLVIVALMYWDIRNRLSKDKDAVQTALKLRTKQREKAYVTLYGLFQRFSINYSSSRKTLLTTDYKELENAVNESFDALDDDTLEAWKAKTVIGGPAQQTEFEAPRFFALVLDHYARLDRRNPAYGLDHPSGGDLDGS